MHESAPAGDGAGLPGDLAADRLQRDSASSRELVLRVRPGCGFGIHPKERLGVGGWSLQGCRKSGVKINRTSLTALPLVLAPGLWLKTMRRCGVTGCGSRKLAGTMR